MDYTLSTFDFNEFKTKEDRIKYSLGTDLWMCTLSKNISFIDNWLALYFQCSFQISASEEKLLKYKYNELGNVKCWSFIMNKNVINNDRNDLSSMV